MRNYGAKGQVKNGDYLSLGTYFQLSIIMDTTTVVQNLNPKSVIMQTTDIIQDLIKDAIGVAPTIVLALITLFGGFWIIGKVTHAMNLGMEKKGIDKTISPFLSSLISVALKGMLLLSVAGMFGIETTSFIAIFTALAFAIGTALSGSIGHFASGIMLLVFKPYKVGDFVTIAGETGTVEAIHVFNTFLISLENKRIIVPNGNITGNTIVNNSGLDNIRVDLKILLDKSADIDLARAVIMLIMQKNEMILKFPAPSVVVSGLPFGHIKLTVCPFTKSENYWAVNFFMHEEIKKELDKNNVPFPKIEDMGLEY
jgi:small conductance mechanosensitive channel